MHILITQLIYVNKLVYYINHWIANKGLTLQWYTCDAESCPVERITAAWRLSTQTPREPSNCKLYALDDRTCGHVKDASSTSVKRGRAPPNQSVMINIYERVIERASRRVPSRCRVFYVVNRCDTSVEDVIKRINVLSSISLIIILGRPPWLPSRDILSRPASHRRTALSEHAHHRLFPTIRRLRQGRLYMVENRGTWFYIECRTSTGERKTASRIRRHREGTVVYSDLRNRKAV